MVQPVGGREGVPRVGWWVAWPGVAWTGVLVLAMTVLALVPAPSPGPCYSWPWSLDPGLWISALDLGISALDLRISESGLRISGISEIRRLGFNAEIHTKPIIG